MSDCRCMQDGSTQHRPDCALRVATMANVPAQPSEDTTTARTSTLTESAQPQYTQGNSADKLPDIRTGAAQPDATGFDFLSHLRRQREFSERTFGPGARTNGVIDHIRKELREIEAKPDDLSEWIGSCLVSPEPMMLRLGPTAAVVIHCANPAIL